MSDAVQDMSSEGVAADELRQFVERYERVDEERAARMDDLKEILSELKGRGYDTKIFRRIIALRKKDHAERQEEESILELYLKALGMAA